MCLKNNITPLIELSQSGNGIHFWIFFEEAIETKKARRLADYLLLIAMKENSLISYQTFDRMFPNQDDIKNGGYGNLIALPLENLKIMKISLYANYLNTYVINPNGQSYLNAKRHAKKKPTDFALACGITIKGKYCFHSYQDNNMCVYPNGKLKDYNKKIVCGEVYFFQN